MAQSHVQMLDDNEYLHNEGELIGIHTGYLDEVNPLILFLRLKSERET